jgi:hypothetical protein
MGFFFKDKWENTYDTMSKPELDTKKTELEGIKKNITELGGEKVISKRLEYVTKLIRKKTVSSGGDKKTRRSSNKMRRTMKK